MTPVALVVFNAILAAAAISDVRSYRIPNALPALLAAAALLLAPPDGLGDLVSRLATVAIVGLAAGVLWLRGALGGGDLKLLAACCAWLPFHTLSTFFLAFAAASLVQGLAVWALSRSGRAVGGRAVVPYAVSIAVAGAAWSLTQLPAAT
ncbi:prepilin peptidase [Phenylobacterium sp.]|jgi:prepilin peptidase CpaA|uniref:prepilin peptidase n=1 Tax=Phenylobacterium sp. TaxID=1871053 RepID=UPI003783210C